MVHSWPQTPQGESVAKPGTPLVITLSIVFKSHIGEVRGNLSNPFVRKDSPWTEISSAETVSHISIISYCIDIVSIRYSETSVRKRQLTLGHPFPHK